MQNEIYTVEELLSKTEKDLLHLPYFGKASLQEVKTVLAKKNLSLNQAVSDSSRVSSLNISVYTLIVLQKAGIKTIEDLTSKTEKDLMRVPYFRPRALLEIKSALVKRGLFLEVSSRSFEH